MFEQALDQKAARVGDKNLTREERTILAIEAFEREVNNGGFSQFFVNSSKEYAPFLVEALNDLGCTEIAALTRQAMKSLGIEGTITVEAIDGVMAVQDEEREAKLGEYDSRYFEIAGDVAGRLLDFIKRNRHKIVLRT
ncbi:DMP19 family protein [Polyangium fumosum]|uniref:DMP19 family protein n=1 Tax=Polyangium fumosum TaxID=889272 RepID=UPI001E2FC0F2|nr:DUF4375 domain-containing protein [Polyangium fumosum]